MASGKIAVIGGGSTYTPELVEGLILKADLLGVAELCLMDIAPQRLEIVGGLLQRMVRAAGDPFRVSVTADRAEAIAGADFVVAQIRVGGNAARAVDERIPLEFDIIGQETTGPGGFAKALRTIPVMLDVAAEMTALTPQAWLINFTNPSGIITEAVHRYRTSRVIGLCNGPIGLQRELAGMFSVKPDEVRMDCLGLNHLSFARGVFVRERDVTQEAIEKYAERADPTQAEYVRAIGMIPSGYLRYYYAHDEVLQKMKAAPQTRGEQVEQIERELLKEYEDPALAKKPERLSQRGGAHYSDVALAVMVSLRRDAAQEQIVNVLNQGSIADLPDDVVVEVSASIGAKGPVPRTMGVLPLAVRGLVQAVKAYEQLTVKAGAEGDRAAALQALIAHPLVGSVTVARQLLDRLLDAHRQYLPQFFGR
jgi:6-phospho-beta-glucosidase